jgi:cystathionine beta-lyase/cystathionine gamma-synthase
MGVSEAMLRLSVGIEDVEDIIEDINIGLEGI